MSSIDGFYENVLNLRPDDFSINLISPWCRIYASVNWVIIGSDCCPFGRSHCLNQCWVIVNWSLGNELQWNSNQNSRKLRLKTSSAKFCPAEMSWHFICWYSLNTDEHGLTLSEKVLTVHAKCKFVLFLFVFKPLSTEANHVRHQCLEA